MVLVMGATGRGHYGMMGKGMMEEKCEKCELMMDKMEKNPSMMHDMMKGKEMKEMKHKGMMK
jgi:hypothetical protein